MTSKKLGISVRQRLSNLAQERDVAYSNVATTFLLERLAARIIADKKLAESLVFKGGYIGLRVYESSRYTIDLDALLKKSNLKETLAAVKIAARQDLGDAAWFVFESEIDLKTQGEYGGIRQVYRAGIGEITKDIKRAQIVHFDLGVGDPVIPKPKKQSTPEIIGGKELSWYVYPVESMIAEKIHALVSREGLSSRSKDIYDLAYFIPKAKKADLLKALDTCFSYRETDLPDDLVGNMKSYDLGLLRRGWSSAVSGLANPPDFDETYQAVLTELKKKIGKP